MKGYLLDVNVLIALLWTRHEHHAAAQRWFTEASRQGWATCNLTQLAFVRIVTNPAFSPDAIRASQAVEVLAANLEHPAHQVWEDRWGVGALLAPFLSRLIGHRQVTDAYLLGLAVRQGGHLATFDRGIASLVSGSELEGRVERIPIEPGA
ncbi:MAG: PIN domain-containing protein [Thermoanaerobaculia bacterium]|nr:PIN domain-containing protein [Thermoanaerobaculia bacterium]